MNRRTTIWGFTPDLSLKDPSGEIDCRFRCPLEEVSFPFFRDSETQKPPFPKEEVHPGIDVPVFQFGVSVYPGADAEFTLYEDSGDGYQYEDGEFLELPMRWDEQNAKLEFGSARGAFPGAPGKRAFTVRYPGRTETVRIDPD